jgi:hypothetical protein
VKKLLILACLVSIASPATSFAGGSGHGQGYDTFDNVARESYQVRTAHGKVFNLRDIGGNTQNCQPPRHLVRSERCTAIGGGIRCQFDCL